MTQIDWYIEGVEFSNCNCDYGCPCQFKSRRPTHGDCRGFAAVRIDKGASDRTGIGLEHTGDNDAYFSTLDIHVKLDVFEKRGMDDA